MQQCTKIFISYLHEAQHVSGGQLPATTRPTTLHVCKTRGCSCSFRFLMIGGVSPETCWASCKYEIKILIHCCIFLDFLCKLFSFDFDTSRSFCLLCLSWQELVTVNYGTNVLRLFSNTYSSYTTYKSIFRIIFIAKQYSSSSYICHGVGPLVDPFRSHVSRSLFKGLPWFLLPVGE